MEEEAEKHNEPEKVENRIKEDLKKELRDRMDSYLDESEAEIDQASACWQTTQDHCGGRKSRLGFL